MEQLYT